MSDSLLSQKIPRRTDGKRKTARLPWGEPLRGNQMLGSTNTIDAEESAGNPVFDHRHMQTAKNLIQRLVTKGATKGPIYEVVDVSPEVAAILLGRNPADENRRISPTVVSRYAKDMAAQRWQGLNGQSLVVSDTGHLNDGQHRLSAIIESGSTIRTLIVFGVPRDARLTLDQNRNRTSGDYLAMQGIKNSNTVAAVARTLMTLDYGTRAYQPTSKNFLPPSKARPTKAEVHEYATGCLQEIEDAYGIYDTCHTSLPVSLARITSPILYIYRAGNDWDEVTRFFLAIAYGENLTKTMPAYVARARLISEQAAGNMTAGMALEITVRAWNAHAQGRAMRRLALRYRIPEVVVA